MTILTELRSWLPPNALPVSPAPKPGDEAPEVVPDLTYASHKPTVLAFLRHCGCPFAEQSYLRLRKAAKAHPTIDFIAISHSDGPATEKWQKNLPTEKEGVDGDLTNFRTVIDPEKKIFAAYGIGTTGIGHVFNFTSFSQMNRVKKEEGINVRSTESGSRWQSSGAYAVDAQGKVQWGGPSKRADDVPDFEEAVKAIEAK